MYTLHITKLWVFLSITGALPFVPAWGFNLIIFHIFKWYFGHKSMQKKCLTIHQNTGNCLWNLLFSCCMCSPELKWRLWLQNVFFFFSWLWFIHLYISLSASELHTWLITVDWQTALSVISGGCCGLTRVSKLKRISYQKHFRRLSVCCWAATGGRSVSSSGDSVSVCSV